MGANPHLYYVRLFHLYKHTHITSYVSTFLHTYLAFLFHAKNNFGPFQCFSVKRSMLIFLKAMSKSEIANVLF